jgi:hypothetical protein
MFYEKIFIVGFLGVCHNTNQAEWVRVDSGVKLGEMHYFDPATIQKNGYFRKVWILASYDHKQPGGYQSVKNLEGVS